MAGLFRAVKSIFNPQVLYEETVEAMVNAAVKARLAHPNSCPHTWLAASWASRMQAKGVPVTDLMSAASLDATELLATLPWPENASALGLLTFQDENPAMALTLPYVVQEFSSYQRLIAMYKLDPELKRRRYEEHNGRPLPSKEPPPLDDAAELWRHKAFAALVLKWSDGDLTDAELFSGIERFRSGAPADPPPPYVEVLVQRR